MSQVAIANATSSSTKRLVADSFSRSVILLACLTIMQRGIGFVRSFYVCGSLSPVEVGQWDLAFNFLMIVAPLAVFGIPGSFGRYVARYESNGHQGRFLAQTSLACLAMVTLWSIFIYLFRSTIAVYFFGAAEQANTVAILAMGLPLIVFFNFATSWFTGKRLNRIVFRVQFVQTVCFAGLCVLALNVFSVSADAVIISYLLSCLAGLFLAASYALIKEPTENVSEMNDGDTSIWRKILPFAVWVWISNTLINLFSVCDRLLLVNFHPDSHVDIQYLVGQYHTACLFPMLLMTLGAMAGSMLIPYLSKDWEAGSRDSVTDRMNLMLKAIGLLCVFASVGILFVAPLLFGGIWHDKYAMGESLLPITLCYCSLAAMTMVAQKYFWCIEKTWFSSSMLMVGLVANFVLGVALVGPYGIEGVVASTLASHAIVLAGVLLLCKRHGMRTDIGVVVIAVSLLAICFGKLAACVTLACLIYAVVATNLFFSETFKQEMIGRVRSLRESMTESTT